MLLTRRKRMNFISLEEYAIGYVLMKIMLGKNYNVFHKAEHKRLRYNVS